MSTPLWIAVLSSSLVSAALGAGLTGFFTLRGKRTEYANDYFRQVLQRRLSAYELIEKLIFNFKIANPHAPGVMAHHVFSSKDEADPGRIHMLIYHIAAESFWLSDEIFQKSREIDLVLILKTDSISWIDFGIANYERLASIRIDLERLYAHDLRTLHEVPKFLRSKRHLDKLQVIYVPPFTPHEKSGTAPHFTSADRSPS